MSKTKKPEVNQEQLEVLEVSTEDLKKVDIKFINKLNTPFFKSFLVLSFLFIFLTLFYSFWVQKQFQKTLALYLPDETTIAFFETKTGLYSHWQNLFDIDTLILNPSNLINLLNSNLQKNLSLHLYQGEVIPVFIYRLDRDIAKQIQFPVIVTAQNTDITWYYSLSKDILVISSNRNFNNQILQQNQRSIFHNSIFQETFVNIPQQHLALFAFNWSMLEQISTDSVLPNTTLSYLFPLFDQFGFTAGALKPHKSSLLINTYTNTISSSFTLSPKASLLRYSDNLLQNKIPSELDYLYHGKNLTSLILNFLNNTNPNTITSLKNQLLQRGIDEDSFALIVNTFTSEYLVYKESQTENINIIIPKQDLQTQQNLLNTFSQVEAYFNPVLEFQTLPDFSRVSIKKPREPKPRQLDFNTTNYTFDFKEIQNSIVFDFSNSDYDKLTYFFSDTQKTQQQANQSKFNFRPIHPEATSLSFYNSEYLQEFIPKELHKFIQNFSNIVMSSYFFDDGLQVTIQMHEKE